MRFKILTAAALMICCAGCVKVNNGMGGELIPDNLKYSVFAPDDILLKDFEMQEIDSLSGYSDYWFSIGAIRDPEFGLTTRKTAVTLVPLCQGETWDFGKDPKVKQFHFAVAMDSTSIADPSQECILQTLNVYELEKALDPKKDFNCKGDIKHKTAKINKSFFINGTDSLAFNFTQEFAEKYFSITKEELHDMDKYLKHYPGIFLETSNPEGIGGRINTFTLQLGYSVSQKYITGNYAKLVFNSEYDGVRKDTTFYFYMGAPEFTNVDTLLKDHGTGNFEQYALTLTHSEGSTERQCHAADKKELTMEGGMGPKPFIRAKELARLTREAIIADGNDPKKAIINSAALEFSFIFPSDYKMMFKYPKILSPLCLFKSDSSAVFVNLTDFSDESENIGEINRSLLKYSPNITYHLQEILNCTDEELAKGTHDIYLMSMAYESYENTTKDDELAEYYQYLAYQSYYSSMYGSGMNNGYGYGSYTDYYSYMNAAQYASGTSISNTSLLPDKTRYYCAKLIGPAADDKTRVPKLKLTYSVPLE